MVAPSGGNAPAASSTSFSAYPPSTAPPYHYPPASQVENIGVPPFASRFFSWPHSRHSHVFFSGYCGIYFLHKKLVKCWIQSQLTGSISRTTPTSLNHPLHSLGSIQTVVNSQVLAAVDTDNIRVLQHIHLHMELDIHPADTLNTKLNLTLVKQVQSVDIK